MKFFLGIAISLVMATMLAAVIVMTPPAPSEPCGNIGKTHCAGEKACRREIEYWR